VEWTSYEQTLLMKNMYQELEQALRISARTVYVAVPWETQS